MDREPGDVELLFERIGLRLLRRVTGKDGLGARSHGQRLFSMSRVILF